MVLSISCSHKGHMTCEGNITCHGCVERPFNLFMFQWLHSAKICLCQSHNIFSHVCGSVRVLVAGGRGFVMSKEILITTAQGEFFSVHLIGFFCRAFIFISLLCINFQFWQLRERHHLMEFHFYQRHNMCLYQERQLTSCTQCRYINCLT